jgi:glucosamine-6-phosphate deaminase
MGIQIFRDAEQLGDCVARRIVAIIDHHPEAVIGLATGSSPLATYAAWARIAAVRGTAQGGVRGFALDEYLGIDPEHSESYRNVIRRTVTEQVGLDPDRVRVLAGTGDVVAQAAVFEADIITAGGVDLQLLGLGRNGHLGFNEPGSAFDSRTRVIDLTESTIADNARFFAGVTDVPTQAVTQGLGTILAARELVVIALGEGKAEAVAASLEGPETIDMPGSVLRRHQNVHWCLDEAAASRLSKDSFRLVDGYGRYPRAAAGLIS